MWLIYILQILLGAVAPIGATLVAIVLSITHWRHLLLSAGIAALMYWVPERFGQWWIYWSGLTIVVICLFDRRVLRPTTIGLVVGLVGAITSGILELSNHPLQLVDKVDAIQGGLCLTAWGAFIGFCCGKKRIEHTTSTQ